MAEFNVIRAGRRQEDYAEKLIGNMFADDIIFYRRGYGICDSTPELVVSSFNSIRNTYCKMNPIKIHYMELLIEYEIDVVAVRLVADQLGRFLYENGFQSFIGALDTGDRFIISIVMNSVSYNGGSLFYDNNACYQIFYQFLCDLLPVSWNINFSENTFFNPQKREGNYVHGQFA